MAVYGYIRVSTDAQAEAGESLGVQRRQLEGWAMMNGHELASVFEERGVSGSIAIKSRPQGAELWGGLKRGDTIIAAKLDRMFRSALDALQMVEELKAKGVALVLLDLGGDVIGNGLSKLFLTIAAAFAEAERDRIKERTAQVKQDQKARGRFLGGTVPFGFRVDDGGALVKDTKEQAIIRDIRKLKTGSTFRALQSRIESLHGRRLSLDALHRIIKDSPNMA